MNVVGIIAEYNPFHKGHFYHIEEAKKRAGADYCIVVMSGDFVQRGRGDPVGIRTRDPQLRRLLLYPAELPDHGFS